MDRELKILIVEDSTEDLDLIKRELSRGGVRSKFVVVDERANFEKALSEFGPEIIISDHSLPRFNSIEALKISRTHARTTGITIPFILVTGSVSEEFAVQIIKAGADDYILKDRLTRLPSAIWSALEKLKVENERVRAQIEKREVFEILQKSLDEIYIFNPDTLLYDYVNDGALKNLGYRREEMSGLTPLDIQAQLREPAFRELLKSVEEDDTQKRIYETRYQRKDRSTYAVEVHLQSVMHGTQRSFLAIVTDITDVNRYLTKLEQQNEQLKEIAWVQSHEVRAPLSRIMGLVMLLTRGDSNIKLEEALGHLQTSAQELDEAIKRIVRKTEAIVDLNQKSPRA